MANRGRHGKRKRALRVASATSNHETGLKQNKRRLPAEVISHIISFFVAGGVQLSTDPQYESNVMAIRALLATNLQIKRETLRQIYKQPLFINITNAFSCGCSDVEIDHAPVHKVTIVKKILYLPLKKWPEIVIRFIPTKRAAMCDLEDTTTLGGNDPIGIHFDSAIRCIKRQSDWLARFLRLQYQPIQRYSRDLKDQVVEKIFLTTLALKYQPMPEKLVYRDDEGSCPLNLGFFFDGFEEIRHPRAPRNVPLWDFDMVVGLLHEWLWSTFGDRDQIRLPALMAVAFTPANDPTIQEYFPRHPQKLADYFQHLFWQWWTPSLQIKSSPTFGLCNIISSCPRRSTYQSFLNPKTPLPLGQMWTLWGRGVLRVTVSKSAADGVESWEGELLALEHLPAEAM